MSNEIMQVATPAPSRPPMPPREGLSRRLVEIFFRTIVVGLGIGAVLLIFGGVVQWSERSACNVTRVSLYGELMTYGADEFGTDANAVLSALEQAQGDATVKGIIIDVDSPGGLPVAGEEIATMVASLDKPVVAVIRSVGASAAYWAVSTADHILASRSSDVGSIGVTATFVDESEKNKKDGVIYNEFASGKYKNLGTPTRPITEEERLLVERDIKEIFDHFVESVAVARGLSIEVVRAFADGSTMTGARALDGKLIDGIGGMPEAKKYLADILAEEVTICEQLPAM